MVGAWCHQRAEKEPLQHEGSKAGVCLTYPTTMRTPGNPGVGKECWGDLGTRARSTLRLHTQSMALSGHIPAGTLDTPTPFSSILFQKKMLGLLGIAWVRIGYRAV